MVGKLFTTIKKMLEKYSNGYFFAKDIKYDDQIKKQFIHFDNIDDVKNLLNEDKN